MTVDDGAAAVDRVLSGDVAAFAEIVERWQDPLVALAYRFCHDRGRAEDMAQEAFVRAFRALHQWRREAAFSTWLFALATNVYRAELRRRRAPLVSLDDVATTRTRTAAPRCGALCTRCRRGTATRWCCSISTRWMSSERRRASAYRWGP
jgi:RNA polymerase sigma-70 factor (ECF subfamily)